MYVSVSDNDVERHLSMTFLFEFETLKAKVYNQVAGKVMKVRKGTFFLLLFERDTCELTQVVYPFFFTKGLSGERGTMGRDGAVGTRVMAHVIPVFLQYFISSQALVRV